MSEDTPVNFHNVINNPPDYLLKKWEWKENDLPEIHEQKIFSLKENKNFSFLATNNILSWDSDNKYWYEDILSSLEGTKSKSIAIPKFPLAAI